MKGLSLCFLLIIGFYSFSQTKKVRLKLVQYLPYCGGMKPNKDLENNPNKGTLYANKKLIIINEHQEIDTITTDKSGYIKTTWAYGTYLLFEPWKFYKKIPSGQNPDNVDMDCLKEEWKKEDLKIVVSKKTITVANNIIFIKCPYQFPCLIKKYLPQ